MVKNKVCKKLCLASLSATLAFGVPAYAAQYDVADYSNTPDSLIDHSPAFQNGDILNIKKDLTADGNISDLPSVTINGNGYTLDGNGNESGFSISESNTITINNYLIKNYTTALENKGSTILSGNNGITQILSNIINESTLNTQSGTNGYVNLANVSSDNTKGTINNAGNLKITGTITNQTVNTNGTLTLGNYGSSPENGYFSDSDLNLNGGSLGVANGEIVSISLSDLSVTNPTNILFDANLAQGTSDSFSVANQIGRAHV